MVLLSNSNFLEIRQPKSELKCLNGFKVKVIPATQKEFMDSLKEGSESMNINFTDETIKEILTKKATPKKSD
jgi:hypothetical protein